MRKHFLLMVTFLLFGIGVLGQTQVNNLCTDDDLCTEIELKREKPLRDGDIHMPPLGRSVTLNPAYAYLSNKVITLTFTECMPDATISVTNVATGETVYSKSYMNPSMIYIDLSTDDSGEYSIEIISEEAWLYGNFTI